jgi:predicted ATP-grasp superfamily ATP-dependent carboligase
MSPRVVATDVEERSMLAAQRAMHAAGIKVTAVANSTVAAGLWSRTASRRVLAPDPVTSADRFIGVLAGLVRRESHDVLLAGTDVSLLLVSRYRDVFEPHVRLGLPDHETVRAALDRVAVQQAATKVGLPPPESRLCDGADDAVAAAAAFGYPVILKPIDTVVDVDGALIRSASEMARDEQSVRDAASRFKQCIVQRRLQGAVFSVGGVATRDGLHAHVVSRYLRTWPPYAGNACFSETIVAPAELIRRAERLVCALGWEGIFELELLALADGRFHAIDFNPRAYGSMALANAAGVPLAALWCRYVLGETPPAPVARTGVRYRWGDADYRSLITQVRNGAAATSLLEARPRRGIARAFLAPSDPLPGLARVAQLSALLVGYAAHDGTLKPHVAPR